MESSRAGKTITILVFILVVFGLVMISSAGVVDAQKKFGSPYYYFTHQLIFGALPGLAAFFIISRINYKNWRKLAIPLLLVAVALLILVFVPGVGFGLRGARRWINLGFITFQPSEILKPVLVIYLAAWFSSWNERSQRWSYSSIPFFVVLAFIWLMFFKQPDVGTLIVISAIAFSMYFFAGVNVAKFLGTILIVAIILGLLLFLAPYRHDRITAFFNRTNDPQGISYHINQSLIAIGSGGIFGLGFGQSRQKFNYLPEPVGDSIFAIIGEELGLVGMTFLISLFILLAVSLVAVVRGTHDSFGRLAVLGIGVWIMSQFFVNIAAVSGLIPFTGIPLPFISYGGTSLIAILGSLGIIVNVSRYT